MLGQCIFELNLTNFLTILLIFDRIIIFYVIRALVLFKIHHFNQLLFKFLFFIITILKNFHPIFKFIEDGWKVHLLEILVRIDDFQITEVSQSFNLF